MTQCPPLPNTCFLFTRLHNTHMEVHRQHLRSCGRCPATAYRLPFGYTTFFQIKLPENRYHRSKPDAAWPDDASWTRRGKDGARTRTHHAKLFTNLSLPGTFCKTSREVSSTEIRSTTDGVFWRNGSAPTSAPTKTNRTVPADDRDQSLLIAEALISIKLSNGECEP